MRLMYRPFENYLVEDNAFTLVVIESVREFFRFHVDFLDYLTGDGEAFILSQKGKEIAFDKKAHSILNFWDIDLNERKLINRLYDRLQKTYISETSGERVLKLCYQLEQAVKDLLFDEIGISPEEKIYDLPTIFKWFQVGFDPPSNASVIDRIEDYVLARCNYLSEQLFLFNQLASYTSNEDLQELYDFATRENIHIVLIENMVRPSFRELKGRFLLADQDYCEVLIRET